MLVTGEAGIGKTRLVDELLDEARDHGCRTAWGRAWEAGGAPAFWPWIEALRTLGHEHAVAELQTERAVTDDAGARFRLFDRVASSIREEAELTTVIALDDLHVADESTVRLAQLIARTSDLSLLLVGTFRDPMRGALVDLAREGVVVQLAPLTSEEVCALVDAPAEVGRRIAETSGGNPFFADELVRLWRTGNDTGVPSGVREVVRRRAAALPHETVAVLQTAAIVGRDFDVDVLARVTGVRSEAVLDLLGSTADAQLVRAEHDRRWRFVHDLVRAALVDALEPSSRARLHLAVADALEAMPGTPASEIAHHCWEALPVVDRARSARWLAAAAEHALATLAYEDAAQHWRRAADLTDDQNARWSQLMRAGEADHLAGDFVAGQSSFRAASDIATALGDDERFAESVLATAGYADTAPHPDLIALQEHALARLPARDSRLRALLLSNHATYLGNSDRYHEGRARSADALAMARRVGDDDALARVIFNHHFMLIMDAHESDVRLPLAIELVDLTDQLGYAERRVNARVWLAHDLLEKADVAGCERELARANALAESARLRFGVWGTTYPRAFLALLRGQLELAERLGAQAYDAGAATGFADVLGIDAYFTFHLRLAQGRLTELADAATAPGMTVLPAGPAEAQLAVALAAAGQHGEARKLVREVLDRDPTSMEYQAMVLLLAEAIVLSEDERAAAPMYQRLRSLAGVLVPSMICGAPHGAVDRILGGLASLLGLDDAAAAHLEAGRRLNESLGFHRWLEDAAPTPTRARRRDHAPSRVTLDGEYWTFEHAGTTSRLKDSPGVRHLARLLLEPGREHHALDLVGSTGVDDGGRGAVLDDRAKDEYRRRLVELQDDIDDATAANDPARAEAARLELDALIEQLSAAVGLGGRDREGSTATERARQSVTRAIKRAVDRVADADPTLGAHLKATVRTGIYSAYVPDPASPITWEQ